MAVVLAKTYKTLANHLKDKLAPVDILDTIEKNGIQTIPLDIESVYRFYGISIQRIPMDKEISGILEKRRNGWSIFINQWHHPKRQRFTLAHELGHYFLHGNTNNKFIDNTLFLRINETTDQMETDADMFAGELLMPKKQFIDQVNLGNNKISSLAEYFNVSMMAVKVRASILGFRT